MPTTLTTEQILALAPDPSSAKAARGLATATAWVSLGQNESAAWGECKGSAKEPYRIQIDLSEPAFRCSCPSRKFPCKHGLGLLLLLAAQPATFPQANPPPWVEEWLASRAQSAQRRAEKQEREAQQAGDPAVQKKRAEAQARTAAAREAKVAAGLRELERWLRDQVRHGLAAAQTQSPAAWEAMAARMVDAQAPGIARLIRAMAGIPASGAGWQGRLLEWLARLHLLLEGYQRLETLPPESQADIRAMIGFTQSQDELFAQPGLRDRWLVLGQNVEDEDRLRVQRTWLWGQASAQPALILDFSAGNQPLDKSLVPGTVLDADLVFFPSAAPLRALLKQLHQPPALLDSLPATAIAEATGAYAATLARNPWLERFPLALGPVLLLRDPAANGGPPGEGWLARDETGRLLPLTPRFVSGWDLLAVSGGHPLSLFGEWDGDLLHPLSAWVRGNFVIL